MKAVAILLHDLVITTLDLEFLEFVFCFISQITYPFFALGLTWCGLAVEVGYLIVGYYNHLI